MRRSDFIKHVYHELGINPTPTNVAFGVAWAAYEDTQARNNIWATTEPWSGSTLFNTVGVRNYATWQNGVNATVATLLNGYYDKILFALHKDEDVLDLLEALTNSPWGSHPDIELYKSVKAHWGHYDVEVPGSNEVSKPKEKVMSIEDRLKALEEHVFGVSTPEPATDTLESRIAEATTVDTAPAEVETQAEDATEPVEEAPAPASEVDTLESRIAAAQKELDDLKAQE